MISQRKILITGATGQVARPIAEALADRNEVWCAARFTDRAAKAELEAAGIRTAVWELGSDDFSQIPEDFDHVIHSACHIFPVANDYDAAIAANAEGTGLLLAHCRNARSFLHISSLCVYRVNDDPAHVYCERTDPLGSHPGYAPSYSTGKIATEAVVRTLARVFDLPSTIARLGMAYGAAAHGGVPSITLRAMLNGEVIRHPSRDAFNTLIHEDDIVAQVEPLLEAASVPATIVNWASDEHVEEREMYDYIARIAGLTPTLAVDDTAAWAGGCASPEARRAITGPSRVGWKEGILRSLRTNFPEHRFTHLT